MKKTFLAVASVLALALSAPAFAAAQDHHGGSHGSSGGHAGGGHSGGHGAGPLGTSGHGGTPLGTGGHHGGTFGSGGTNPLNHPFVGGRNVRHDRFEIFRHTLRAPHRYHYGSYRRPSGWYYRNWGLGEILPALFFGRQYWLSDYYDFGLQPPPPGCVWVRYGDDALLIDRDTGEVIQVVRGVFY